MSELGKLLPVLMPFISQLINGQNSQNIGGKGRPQPQINPQQFQIPQQLQQQIQTNLNQIPSISEDNPYPAFFAAMAHITNPGAKIAQIPRSGKTDFTNAMPSVSTGDVNIDNLLEKVNNIEMNQGQLANRLQEMFDNFVTDFNNRIG